MTAIIILNVVFCTFVVVAILGLLAFGIVTDRIHAARLGGLSRRATRRAPELRAADRRTGADRRLGSPHPAH